MKWLTHHRAAHQGADGHRLIRRIQSARRLHRNWDIAFERNSCRVPSLHRDQVVPDREIDKCIHCGRFDLIGEFVVYIDLHRGDRV